MSPSGRDVPGEILSFPRVSGDEPQAHTYGPGPI